MAKIPQPPPKNIHCGIISFPDSSLLNTVNGNYSETDGILEFMGFLCKMTPCPPKKEGERENPPEHPFNFLPGLHQKPFRPH